MEACGFKIAEGTDFYKNWSVYVGEAAAHAVGKGLLSEKKRALVLLGLYSLFIEFIAGRLPDTLDEASDGATYMSRAAIEFRDRFVASTMHLKEEGADD
jgi:hypothetical protein